MAALVPGAPTTQYRPWTLHPSAATFGGTIPNGAFWAVAGRITATGIWPISSLGLIVQTSAGNIALGVYHDNGNDQPGQVVGTTGPVACPAAGPQVVPLTAPVTVARGDWFALVADGTTASFVWGAPAGGSSTPAWLSRAWSNGSLVFASNPSGFLSDTRCTAVWGQ